MTQTTVLPAFRFTVEEMVRARESQEALTDNAFSDAGRRWVVAQWLRGLTVAQRRIWFALPDQELIWRICLILDVAGCLRSNAAALYLEHVRRDWQPPPSTPSVIWLKERLRTP